METKAIRSFGCFRVLLACTPRTNTTVKLRGSNSTTSPATETWGHLLVSTNKSNTGCSNVSLTKLTSHWQQSLSKMFCETLGKQQISCFKDLPQPHTHAQRVAPQVLLPREALPAGLTGVGPLPGVRADVPLQDPLLLGRVGTERAFVELDWHN